MLLPLNKQPDMLRKIRSCHLRKNSQDTELCSTDLAFHQVRKIRRIDGYTLLWVPYFLVTHLCFIMCHKYTSPQQCGLRL